MRAESFTELVDEVPADDLGYKLETFDRQRYLESVYDISSKEDERRYGILGIQIVLE